MTAELLIVCGMFTIGVGLFSTTQVGALVDQPVLGLLLLASGMATILLATWK